MPGKWKLPAGLLAASIVFGAAAIGWSIGDAGHFSRFCESNLYWRNEAAHWYRAYLEIGGDPDSLKPRRRGEDSPNAGT